MTLTELRKRGGGLSVKALKKWGKQPVTKNKPLFFTISNQIARFDKQPVTIQQQGNYTFLYCANNPIMTKKTKLFLAIHEGVLKLVKFSGEKKIHEFKLDGEPIKYKDLSVKDDKLLINGEELKEHESGVLMVGKEPVTIADHPIRKRQGDWGLSFFNDPNDYLIAGKNILTINEKYNALKIGEKKIRLEQTNNDLNWAETKEAVNKLQINSEGVYFGDEPLIIKGDKILLGGKEIEAKDRGKLKITGNNKKIAFGSKPILVDSYNNLFLKIKNNQLMVGEHKMIIDGSTIKIEDERENALRKKEDNKLIIYDSTKLRIGTREYFTINKKGELMLNEKEIKAGDKTLTIGKGTANPLKVGDKIIELA